MTDKATRVTIDAEGGFDVTNGHGVIVDVRTRHKKDGTLQVKYTANPVGDDALYAGSAKVVVSITPPEFMENGDADAVKQAAVGGQYARGMIDALIEVIPETLNAAVADACKGALSASALGDMEGILEVAMSLAHELLAKHGSVAEAIKHADPRSNPDLRGKATNDDPLILSLMHGMLVEAIKAHG